MLTIRSAQMRVLADAARRRFEDKLERHLVSLFGAPAQGADVHTAITSARDFGIVTERDVSRYAEHLFRSSGGLDPKVLSKDAQNILFCYGVPAAEKLSRFEAFMRGNRSDQNGRRV